MLRADAEHLVDDTLRSRDGEAEDVTVARSGRVEAGEHGEGGRLACTWWPSKHEIWFVILTTYYLLHWLLAPYYLLLATYYLLLTTCPVVAEQARDLVLVEGEVQLIDSNLLQSA